MFRGTPAQAGVSAATLGDKLSLRWQIGLGDAITAGVVIADNTVYAATENGHLFALDLATGEKRWDFQQADDFFFSPPTVIGDHVYIGSDNGTLFAVSRENGTSVWEFKTTGAIYSSVNFIGKPNTESLRLIFGSYDGSLYCLDNNGKELWKFTVEERVHGTPAIVAGAAAFAGCDGKLHMIDVATGMQLASVEIGSPSASAAASDGSRLYIGTYGDEARAIDFKKVDRANGETAFELQTAWSFTPESRAGPFMSSASVHDGVMIIGSRDKRIWALDAATGKPKWNFQTRGRCEVGGVIVGDRYFVGSNDGTFYALNLADGKPVWQYETGSDITAAPAVVNSCLVTGNAAGRLYCFADGEAPKPPEAETTPTGTE